MKKMKRLRSFWDSLKNTSSGILAVGVTTLLVAISSTATFAVTPFFLKDTLGISLVTIGLLESCTEALSQISRLLSGVISDKLKRCKPMFLLGTVLSFLAKPLMIFATGSGLVLVSKIFDRLGNGFSATPRDSYIALHSTPDTKGANIGLTMTFKTIGCVAGPFLVMICMAIFQKMNWRLLLCFTAIPALLSIFICQKYMHEKAHAEMSSSKNSFKIEDLKDLNSSFWAFLVIMFVFMLARAPECFLVLNLRDSGLPEWFCAGAIGFFNLVSVMISYPAGQMSDKYGRANILLLSFAALAISAFCFTTQAAILGVVGVIFWGIQRASSQIVSVSYVADLVNKNIIGTAIGLLNLVSGVAGIVAGYMVGEMSKSYGISIAYYSSFGFSLLAMLFLFWFSKNVKNNKINI